MMFQQLIADLGARMGLGPLQPDASGGCRLEFENGISIDLETDDSPDPVLLMHAVVGALPHEDRHAFCLRLLAGNYLAGATRGAVLSLDAATEEVVLHRRLRIASCTAELLADELASLLTAAVEWSARLRVQHHHGGQAPGLDASMAGMIRV